MNSAQGNINNKSNLTRVYNKCLIEVSFPSINQFLYLRRLLPIIDYFNPYLEQKDQKEGQKSERCERLEAMLFSDTSTFVQQLLIQHIRAYQDTIERRSPHHFRCLMIFNLVKFITGIDIEEQREIAETISKMFKQEIFSMYRDLAIIVERVGSYPENILLNKELHDEIKKTLASLKEIGQKTERKNNSYVKTVLFEQTSMFTEDHLRHWFVTLNDYARREPRVLKSSLDDEMVCVDIEKFLNKHLNWFESKAERTISNIAPEQARKLYAYLNIDVLRHQENVDDHFFTFSNPIKIVVMGGSSTFHEFLQPLISSLRKFEKIKFINYIRIYIVPLKHFSLADILAKKDHWYQRNIYVPFKITPLTPLLKDKGKKLGKVRRNFDDDVGIIVDDNKDEPKITPMSILENKLQMYLTEANSFLKLYIYEVAGISKYEIVNIY